MRKTIRHAFFASVPLRPIPPRPSFLFPEPVDSPHVHQTITISARADADRVSSITSIAVFIRANP